MKKRCLIALVAAIVINFSPFFIPLEARAISDENIDTNTDTNFAIVIPDKNFEAVIRNTLDKGEGTLTKEDLYSIESINAVGYGITNLQGIENMENLNYVLLGENNITSLEPIKDLTELKFISIGNNKIEDISPISSMDNLLYLELDNNKIKDISSLKNLHSLLYLSIWNNQIEDISSLGALEHLQVLDVFNNNISDITPLENLSELLKLNLSKNAVKDYSILKDMINPEIGAKVLADESEIYASKGEGITERDFEVPGMPSPFTTLYNGNFTDRVVNYDKQWTVKFNKILDENVYSLTDKVYVSYDEYGEHRVAGVTLTGKKTDPDYVKINMPKGGYKPGEYYIIVNNDVKSKGNKTFSKPYRMKFTVK